MGKSLVDKKKVIILVIILLAIVAVFFFSKPKNCESNETCFNSAAAKCSRATLNTLNQDNSYNYEILGKKGDNCLVKVSLIQVSQTQPFDIKQALEGRDMKCSIPFEKLKVPIKEIENFNDYCTGPLKEAILELTIDRMYEIIVQNIGSVASQIKTGI